MRATSAARERPRSARVNERDVREVKPDDERARRKHALLAAAGARCGGSLEAPSGAGRRFAVFGVRAPREHGRGHSPMIVVQNAAGIGEAPQWR
jgi:hypothetical protein